MSDFTDLLDEWALTLSAVSEGTQVVYRRSIGQFTEWLAGQGINAPEDIESRHVHGWLNHLREQGKSDATRRVRLIAVRLWLEYLTEERIIRSNPAAKASLPQAPAQPVPTLADEDIARLLRSCEGPGFLQRRDTAIIRLLLDTGARRAEVVGIDVDDVDLKAGEIILRRTKGGRPRVVPLSGRTTLAMMKYRRVREQRPAAGSPGWFLSTRWSSRWGWRLAPNAINEMLLRRSEAIGLPRVKPHAFRHTWAGDLLDAGAGEGVVERLAGWRSPLMVKRYTAAGAERRARDTARRLARGDRL